MRHTGESTNGIGGFQNEARLHLKEIGCSPRSVEVLDRTIYL